MSTSRIIEYFPEIYHDIFPEIFFTEIEREVVADCNDCVMLSPRHPDGNRVYFSSHSKCCTFFPFIPNFMVGLTLSEGTTRGKELIREWIANGAGILPKGIKATKKYEHLYELSKKDAFGRSQELKCPFYNTDSGMCSVWTGRGAVCSTFFCKHVKGIDGENFWNSAKKYLQVAENTLARYCMLNLNAISGTYFPGAKDQFVYSREDVDQIKPGSYQKIWGEWDGKEEEYYVRCYELVKTVERKEFEKMMGVDQDYILYKVELALDKILNPVLPQVLKINPEASFNKPGKEIYTVSVPSGTFEISDVMFEVLNYFDGKSNVSNVLGKIKDELAVNVEKELLLSFYHNRILIRK